MVIMMSADALATPVVRTSVAILLSIDRLSYSSVTLLVCWRKHSRTKWSISYFWLGVFRYLSCWSLNRIVCIKLLSYFVIHMRNHSCASGYLGALWWQGISSHCGGCIAAALWVAHDRHFCASDVPIKISKRRDGYTNNIELFRPFQIISDGK